MRNSLQSASNHVDGADMADEVPSKTFGLKWPRDLLAKLEYDIGRLRSARSTDDVKYAAFDCAVDAWHMTDWVLAAVDDQRHLELCGEVRLHAQAAVRFSEKQAERLPILKFCRDIANGVKHFALRPKHRLDNVATSANISIRLKSAEDGIAVASASPIAQLIVDGTRYNAVEFFDDAYSQWSDFLKEEGLRQRSSMTTTVLRKDTPHERTA